MLLKSLHMSLHVVWRQRKMSNVIWFVMILEKKSLGVTIDSKLSFNKHIDIIFKTANKKLNRTSS